MRIPSKATAAAVALVLLAGCAPGPNPLAHPGSEHALAGFWMGLWHGLIIWVTFLVSLFSNTVSVYEVFNTGWPYNLGFAIGAACFHGGSGASASRRRRRRDAP